MKVFKPSPRFITRLRVIISLWAVIILGIGILIAGLINLEPLYTQQATTILQLVIVADLIWYLPAIGLIQASYDSRLYWINDEEIIVQSGWLTKSIRRVPLNSVISFEARWDLLDQWLEIGSVYVHTAAECSTHGAQVRLAGLADVDAITQLATRQLQRFRAKQLVNWSLPKGNPDSAYFSRTPGWREGGGETRT